MTAFFAVYLSLSVDKVTNRGVFKLSAENATNTSDDKSIVKNDDSDKLQVNFKEFMTTISVPEYGTDEQQTKLQTLYLGTKWQSNHISAERWFRRPRTALIKTQ
jgi:hypothetical protein